MSGRSPGEEQVESEVGPDLRDGAIVDDATVSAVIATGTPVGGAPVSRRPIGSTLTGRTLIGSTLIGSTLTGSTLTGSTLIGSTLTGSTLTGSTLTGSTLTGSTLTGSTLTGSTLNGSTPTGSTLTDRTLTDRTLTVPTPVAVTRGPGHLRQAVEDAVNERRRTEQAELRHPVTDVFHPHGPLLASLFVPLLERARLEILSDPPSHPPDPIRGFRLGETDDLGRVGIAARRIVEVLSGFAHDPGVRGADPAGALRLPHQGKALHDPRGIRHPPLHCPIAHTQGCGELRGDGTRGHLSVIGVVRLLGNLEREPRPDGQDAVARGLQAADRALDLDKHVGERAERLHLLDRRIRQCCHVFMQSGTTDIRMS